VFNFHAEKPIYLQLMDEIKGRIVAEKLSPGEKIPSIRELASRYAVNPNTVQRALLELEREGLLDTKRASGKTVTEDIQMIRGLREKLGAEQMEACLDALEAIGYGPAEASTLFSKALQERHKEST
jgi:DNA-binding transcriptional regulator YhcF (GntR family)